MASPLPREGQSSNRGALPLRACSVVSSKISCNCPQWRADQPPPCPPPPSWASEDWGGVVGSGAGSGGQGWGGLGRSPGFSPALLSAPHGSGSGLGLPHPLLPPLFAPFLLSPHHPLSSSESFLFSPSCVFLCPGRSLTFTFLGFLLHCLVSFSLFLSFSLLCSPLPVSPSLPLTLQHSPA